MLLGRSAVAWRGGTWNDRLSDICMRAAEAAHITFEEPETRVLTELLERMTTHRRKHRTKESLEAIVDFWWRLQTYRRRWLEKKGRQDTAEEVLSEAEIQKVKRDWEDGDMSYELDEQQRLQHLPSIYNAAMHNKSGWATVANAIIKYRLPQLPNLEANAGVAEHVIKIESFCRDWLEWSKKIAAASVLYWNSEEYKKARASSALQTAR